ncbi:hypothetical protein [Paenibacillus sp. NAIST15-1]|uniref:hypothetical protein n=1 Tax=Paenibacillus sp. NAIST15-1 TaxID=1605994 RepID=UPI00093463B6|nr:hypothetical protein [Paenibacillus sp. NAIST15-1]
MVEWTVLLTWLTNHSDWLLLITLVLHLSSSVWVVIDSIRIEHSVFFTVGMTTIVVIAPLFGLCIYMMIRNTKRTAHRNHRRRTGTSAV